MKILVCCKIVPEEQDIKVSGDGALDLAGASSKISPYDLNAVQAAVDLAKGVGDTQVVALSLNTAKILDATKIQKDILSRGPDKLVCILLDEGSTPLPDQTSAILAEAVRKEGADLVILGEGSGDLYAQQTGILLGEKLGMPTINAVSGIALADGIATVSRSLENETEKLEISLPCVLSVTTDINTPAIPTMKSILAAGKKPVEKLNAKDLGEWSPLSRLESVLAPQQKERGHHIFENDSEENIAAFAEALRKIL